MKRIIIATIASAIFSTSAMAADKACFFMPEDVEESRIEREVKKMAKIGIKAEFKREMKDCSADTLIFDTDRYEELLHIQVQKACDKETVVIAGGVLSCQAD